MYKYKIPLKIIKMTKNFNEYDYIYVTKEFNV